MIGDGVHDDEDGGAVGVEEEFGRDVEVCCVGVEECDELFGVGWSHFGGMFGVCCCWWFGVVGCVGVGELGIGVHLSRSSAASYGRSRHVVS